MNLIEYGISKGRQIGIEQGERLGRANGLSKLPGNTMPTRKILSPNSVKSLPSANMKPANISKNLNLQINIR